jgi:hypothetical protein
MLNTYIKNRGITKTIVHNNDNNIINEINWDADYDGDIASITVNTNTDGKHDQFNITLDNQDLANILNVESVNKPLHKRLKDDFRELSQFKEPLYIELPVPEIKPKEPKSVEEIFSRHISSPLPNEELIIPLTIDNRSTKKYTLTPKRRHKKIKSNLSHKVYKKIKSHNHSKSKTNSRVRYSRKKTSSNDFL